MPMTVANIITIFRILTIPFFIATILYYTHETDYLRHAALGIFLFSSVSDAVDGYIARKHGQMTDIGAVLDPLADKLLLISAFICLYKVGVNFPVVRFPLWLIVAVLSRDIIVLGGILVIHILKGKVKMKTTFLGKATTFFQMICVLLMLLQWIISPVVWYITAFLSIVSAVDYLRRGMTQLG
ncbi:MAG: CDP-diacylglycerol--glycerol-3-phosphate 3-phosphatidyltransferase [Candidatus Omnitrophica bacterium]|nr:CDP-diacylglycerol--glycerol-3-phosphate 3-phosphatidyltransferase [Candidatus Omnitrophota bacterium]